MCGDPAVHKLDALAELALLKPLGVGHAEVLIQHLHRFNGSIAAGGLGVAGGTLLIQAVAGGAGIVSAHIASNAIEGAKAKKENEKFREQLKKAKIDDATKQKIIIKLNEKINSIQTALEEEKRRTQCSEEKIKAMELQLDELEKTLCLAQAI